MTRAKQARMTRAVQARLTRRAFTTVELMIALVIGGIVAASIGTVLRRQQRFFTNAAVLVERRVALRDATAILPAEMRSLARGDILAYSDSSLEIRATIGAAIACDTVAGGNAIDLAPIRPSSAVPLAAFSTTPQAGDIALVFDAGATSSPADDAWIPLAIDAAASTTNTCSASPLLDAVADAALPRLRVRFTPGTRVPPTVAPGAFVHVLRHIRYRLYRSSSDWYLGYSEWDGTAFTVVQPVSGPYASYSARPGSSGLMLRYLDDDNAAVLPTSDPARIARIHVVARTQLGAGLAALQLVDSQSVAVRPRNR